jgi:hypothetical protein
VRHRALTARAACAEGMSSDAAAALSLPEPDRRGCWLRWRAKRGHGGAHGARGRHSETIHSSVGDVAVSPACLIEIAREAEAAGFESVRIVEYEYDSFAYDQAIVMGTSRVLTGSCIARYFTRHPFSRPRPPPSSVSSHPGGSLSGSARDPVSGRTPGCPAAVGPAVRTSRGPAARIHPDRPARPNRRCRELPRRVLRLHRRHDARKTGVTTHPHLARGRR